MRESDYSAEVLLLVFAADVRPLPAALEQCQCRLHLRKFCSRQTHFRELAEPLEEESNCSVQVINFAIPQFCVLRCCQNVCFEDEISRR